MRRIYLALLVTALLPACERAADLDERIPADRGGRLEVDLDFGEGLRPDPGSLEIHTHDVDEVRILTDVSGWGASGVRFRVDRDARALRLFGSVGGAFSWMFGGPNVSVRVWVPRDFSLDLRCSAGPIQIDDVEGRVRARTRDAAIDVSGVEGEVSLRTVEGDVHVSEVVGDVDIRATAGNIELSWIRGAVQARTGSGEIRASHVAGPLRVRSDRGGIEISDLEGHLEAKTDRGSVDVSFAASPAGLVETRRGGVEVMLPANAGVELDAVSRRGDVDLDAGIAAKPSGRGEHFQGAIYGGGEPLRVYTARGTVRVRQR